MTLTFRATRKTTAKYSHAMTPTKPSIFPSHRAPLFRGCYCFTSDARSAAVAWQASPRSTADASRSLRAGAAETPSNPMSDDLLIIGPCERAVGRAIVKLSLSLSLSLSLFTLTLHSSLFTRGPRPRPWPAPTATAPSPALSPSYPSSLSPLPILTL